GMRQFNERVVLQALRVHGSLAKADIARLTGLTAQTIGLITARLDEDQLLRREAPVRGRVGQPSVPLGLHPDGAFAIGIKIGRRSADWLLVDFTGQVRERLVLDYAFPDIPVLLPTIKTNLHRLLKKLGPLSDRVVGVGVAAPFQLGGWHRMLGLTAEQSQAWNQIDLGAEVQQLTELPVSFAKDTSAACVAELLQGRGRDIRSFLYLFMDTFVGGGLVLDSHLHRGIHGNAGAVASLPLRVVQGGEPAPQLISEASLWDLEQRFRQHGLDPMAAYDERALQSPWLPYSQEWIERAAPALAQCVVSGTAFLDVEAVVMDGAIAPDLLRALCERTRAALAAYNWEGLHRPRLELGSIGSDARALGGALLPLHACFAPDHDVILKV
ncbi:ROK family transcriptional regulator, partial [Hydrogenophaga sp.]|uniref:ROK family transcriptional regulator n=1 Tax=Hydrogenophaga sp. TaxID=1904254 RepID=UPI0025BA743D